MPDRSAGLRALDEHARWALDVRNYDHILAAMEAGLVGDALLIARAGPRGAFEAGAWTGHARAGSTAGAVPTVDRAARGVRRAVRAPADARCRGAGARGAGAAGRGPGLLHHAERRGPDHGGALAPELIREYLLPEGSEPFWEAVLERCVALTLAREPHHCGGLLASGELFRDAAEVLFRELLRVEPP